MVTSVNMRFQISTPATAQLHNVYLRSIRPVGTISHHPESWPYGIIMPCSREKYSCFESASHKSLVVLSVKPCGLIVVCSVSWVVECWLVDCLDNEIAIFRVCVFREVDLLLFVSVSHIISYRPFVGIDFWAIKFIVKDKYPIFCSV